MVTRKPPSPREVALWRYEQIEDALGEDVPAFERGEILRRRSRTPVLWPSGATRKLSRASLYRWVTAYARHGLPGLRPRPRRDRAKPRRKLNEQVIQEALRLLENDPGITLTLLVAALEATFPEDAPLPRSTLQRRLASKPAYAHITRLRRRKQRRTRFVARCVHDIWQTDGKGPFPVRLRAGEVILVHILSVLDDASRAVLAALVVESPDLAAAVLVLRRAALRWGLPNRLYADRASIFDSHAFRAGLAALGIHRIRTRARNAEVRGKIEAYHRTLTMWFCDRLEAQGVVDPQHLQQLLDGVLGAVYQPHKHRGLKVPPEVALAGRVSRRTVAPTRLVDAFRQERRLKTHPKTGEIDIGPCLYLVPDELRGQRVTVLCDPALEVPPLLVHPVSGATLTLRPANVRAGDADRDTSAGNPPEPNERWADGPLQAIYDHWRGQVRPLAEPGFGLPELYALLARAAGRHVPQSDAEAALVQAVYRKIGPLPRAATESACAAIALKLGRGRPLKTYLDALARLCFTGATS